MRTLAAALAAVTVGACAPRVTPPDPWKGRSEPTPEATAAAGWTPVAAASATPGPAAAATASGGSLDRCGDVVEGPAPAGTKIHTLRFLDVGQGDAALVTTASGKQILIDAGERDERAKIVADLRAAGVDRIDLLMASHPHLDHIGGMRMVIDSFPVRLYVDPGTDHATDTYRDLLLGIQARKIPYQVLRAGKTIKIGDEATLSVLSPGETLLSSARSFENANSLVVKLSIGTFDVLFTGDAEPETLESLLSSGSLAGSSIELLKVAHHGSRYGTTRAFLDELRPKVAVISCGFRNEYRHPHPETLEVLAADCVRTYRTDRDGTVVVKTDGTGFRVAAERGTTPDLARPGDAPHPHGGTGSKGPFYASKRGKTFHVEGCFHLARVDEADRVLYHTADEAVAAGLRAASGCRVPKNGDSTSSPRASSGAAWKGPVFASSRGKVFHPAGCPHIDKIKEENRVEYSSAEEAQAAGLRAGSSCSPGGSR